MLPSKRSAGASPAVDSATLHAHRAGRGRNGARQPLYRGYLERSGEPEGASTVPDNCALQPRKQIETNDEIAVFLSHGVKLKLYEYPDVERTFFPSSASDQEAREKRYDQTQKDKVARIVQIRNTFGEVNSYFDTLTNSDAASASGAMALCKLRSCADGLYHGAALSPFELSQVEELKKHYVEEWAPRIAESLSSPTVHQNVLRIQEQKSVPQCNLWMDRLSDVAAGRDLAGIIRFVVRDSQFIYQIFNPEDAAISRVHRQLMDASRVRNRAPSQLGRSPLDARSVGYLQTRTPLNPPSVSAHSVPFDPSPSPTPAMTPCSPATAKMESSFVIEIPVSHQLREGRAVDCAMHLFHDQFWKSRGMWIPRAIFALKTLNARVAANYSEHGGANTGGAPSRRAGPYGSGRVSHTNQSEPIPMGAMLASRFRWTCALLRCLEEVCDMQSCPVAAVQARARVNHQGRRSTPSAADAPAKKYVREDAFVVYMFAVVERLLVNCLLDPDVALEWISWQLRSGIPDEQDTLRIHRLRSVICSCVPMGLLRSQTLAISAQTSRVAKNSNTADQCLTAETVRKELRAVLVNCMREKAAGIVEGEVLDDLFFKLDCLSAASTQQSALRWSIRVVLRTALQRAYRESSVPITDVSPIILYMVSLLVGWSHASAESTVSGDASSFMQEVLRELLRGWVGAAGPAVPAPAHWLHILKAATQYVQVVLNAPFDSILDAVREIHIVGEGGDSVPPKLIAQMLEWIPSTFMRSSKPSSASALPRAEAMSIISCERNLLLLNVLGRCSDMFDLSRAVQLVSDLLRCTLRTRSAPHIVSAQLIADLAQSLEKIAHALQVQSSEVVKSALATLSAVASASPHVALTAAESILVLILRCAQPFVRYTVVESMTKVASEILGEFVSSHIEKGGKDALTADPRTIARVLARLGDSLIRCAESCGDGGQLAAWISGLWNEMLAAHMSALGSSSDIESFDPRQSLDRISALFKMYAGANRAGYGLGSDEHIDEASILALKLIVSSFVFDVHGVEWPGAGDSSDSNDFMDGNARLSATLRILNNLSSRSTALTRADTIQYVSDVVSASIQTCLADNTLDTVEVFPAIWERAVLVTSCAVRYRVITVDGLLDNARDGSLDGDQSYSAPLTVCALGVLLRDRMHVPVLLTKPDMLKLCEVLTAGNLPSPDVCAPASVIMDGMIESIRSIASLWMVVGPGTLFERSLLRLQLVQSLFARRVGERIGDARTAIESMACGRSSDRWMGLVILLLSCDSLAERSFATDIVMGLVDPSGSGIPSTGDSFNSHGLMAHFVAHLPEDFFAARLESYKAIGSRTADEKQREVEDVDAADIAAAVLLAHFLSDESTMDAVPVASRKRFVLFEYAWTTMWKCVSLHDTSVRARLNIRPWLRRLASVAHTALPPSPIGGSKCVKIITESAQKVLEPIKRAPFVDHTLVTEIAIALARSVAGSASGWPVQCESSASQQLCRLLLTGATWASDETACADAVKDAYIVLGKHTDGDESVARTPSLISRIRRFIAPHPPDKPSPSDAFTIEQRKVPHQLHDILSISGWSTVDGVLRFSTTAQAPVPSVPMAWLSPVNIRRIDDDAPAVVAAVSADVKMEEG